VVAVRCSTKICSGFNQVFVSDAACRGQHGTESEDVAGGYDTSAHIVLCSGHSVDC